MIAWLRHHRRALAAALRPLGAQAFTTALTALAMGAAISLPSGLYLGLANLGRVAGNLPAQPEISVFVDDQASETQKQAIAARLRRPDIAQARFVSKDAALAALSATQGLADVTAGLAGNPLPDAWVVRPRDASRDALERVDAALRGLPGVAETHLDSQWAERLQAGLDIGRTVVWLLGSLFAIALVAISGNAIRAQVLARRDEIHVSRLIGATDRQVRRPFLYVGALQGLFGGLAAGGVLAVAGTVLEAPVAHLAALYGSSFHLLPPTVLDSAIVLGLSTLFGWLGASVAVTRALRQVDASRP